MKYWIIFTILATFTASANSDAQGTVNEYKYYDYNTDGFVKEEKSVKSNGDTLIKRYTYPKDVLKNYFPPCGTLSPTTSGYIGLSALNIIDQPIESYTIVKDHNTNAETVIGGELFLYNTSALHPSARLGIETSIPIANFSPCQYSQTFCDTKYSSYYKLQETFDSYDNYGNLLQMTAVGGETTSFIYGYKNAYKIAKIKNAPLQKVSYSSFENTSELGGFTYDPNATVNTAATGLKALNLNATTITFSIPPNSGSYIVSCWRWGSSINIPWGTSAITGTAVTGWVYEQRTINSATSSPLIITITGNCIIDELRLYPLGAEMETYTYLPMVGVSSSCDVKNQITYYSYDELGRMTLVKDQAGNIKKKTEYGIQTQE